MEQLRLIYEQIEAAKAHIASGVTLNFRLALILLDNVAELLMSRSLQEQFAFEDYFYPPEHQARLGEAYRPKYTQQERVSSQREFEPKLRILGFRLNKITPNERSTLKVCHRLRNEAFHVGTVRSAVLSQVALLLFQTTVDLTEKLLAGQVFWLPVGRLGGADGAFLARFNLADALALASDQGRSQMATALKQGVVLDPATFATTLSEDLIQRLDDDIVGGLGYLNEQKSDAQIDYNLQYTQFWKDEGIALAKGGARGQALDDAFAAWQQAGRAEFTLARIAYWRRQADAIGRCNRPAVALDRWYAIDERIQPLETGISKAVADYDDHINNLLH